MPKIVFDIGDESYDLLLRAGTKLYLDKGKKYNESDFMRFIVKEYLNKSKIDGDEGLRE